VAAEAEVNSVAEGQVRDLAMDVELVGIAEGALVPVRRAIDQELSAAFGYAAAVPLHIGSDIAGLRWGLVAEQLLDSVRDQCRLVDETRRADPGVRRGPCRPSR
jgi:hypothetical protein